MYRVALGAEGEGRPARRRRPWVTAVPVSQELSSGGVLARRFQWPFCQPGVLRPRGGRHLSGCQQDAFLALEPGGMPWLQQQQAKQGYAAARLSRDE
eukprot:347290-Chlamydomonas_euryale.AAC.5